jgi:hypothetical protein
VGVSTSLLDNTEYIDLLGKTPKTPRWQQNSRASKLLNREKEKRKKRSKREHTNQIFLAG